MEDSIPTAYYDYNSNESCELKNKCLKLKSYKSNDKVVNFFIKLLTTHPSITKISIDMCTININLVEKIGPYISTHTLLNSVYIDFSKFKTVEASKLVDYINMNQNIKELQFFNNERKIISFVIHFNGNYESLSINDYLCDNNMENFINDIQDNYNLKTLYISYNKFSNYGIELFSNYIKNVSCLEKLHISEISFDKNSLKIFSDSLEINRSLKYLDIGNQFNRDVNVYNLFNSIAKNESLEFIDICYFNASESIDIIVNMIKNNKKLYEFILFNIGINDNNLEKILNSLNYNNRIKNITIFEHDSLKSFPQNFVNNTLESLSLSGKFNDIGTNNISDFLKHNNTLKTLCIENLYPNAMNITQIINALNYNDTLRELILEKCCNSDENFINLPNMLTNNTTIKKLTISTFHGEKISTNATKNIISSLKNNNTLTYLVLDEINIKEVENDILEMLEINYSLEYIYGSDKFNHLMTPEARMSRMRFIKTKLATQKFKNIIH